MSAEGWETDPNKKILISDIIGESFEDDFYSFDMTEVQDLVSHLQNDDAIDLPHAEVLQQKALRCADILSEYIGKVVKAVSYYDAKITSTKNGAALNYTNSGGKTTMDMRRYAGESDPEVERLNLALAKVKGTKAVLDKKYEIVIKSHHHYKDIAAGLRKTVLGYN